MKLKTTLILALIFMKIGTVQAQFGIGTWSPDNSSILEVLSTEKGILIPRMIASTSILNPAKGLLYFNTSTNSIEINEGNLSDPFWVALVGILGPIGNTGLKGDIGPIGFPGQTPLNNTGAIGSTIVGGYLNLACGIYSTVVGGLENEACGAYSIIGGGTKNKTPAENATIAGGSNNLAAGTNSFIGGGEWNNATALNATVSGGSTNHALSISSTISGGKSNTITTENGVISGGFNNKVNALNATVSGGEYNTTNGLGSTVSGGSHNTAASYGEWVGGLYSTNYTSTAATSATEFIATDRIFNVGNGTSDTNRKDAFTILKNGVATLPSVTNTLISEGSIKAVVTKEYTNATYSKINTIAPETKNSDGVPGEVRLTQNYIYSCISKDYWIRTPVAAW